MSMTGCRRCSPSFRQSMGRCRSRWCTRRDLREWCSRHYRYRTLSSRAGRMTECYLLPQCGGFHPSALRQTTSSSPAAVSAAAERERAEAPEVWEALAPLQARRALPELALQAMRALRAPVRGPERVPLQAPPRVAVLAAGREQGLNTRLLQLPLSPLRAITKIGFSSYRE